MSHVTLVEDEGSSEEDSKFEDWVAELRFAQFLPGFGNCQTFWLIWAGCSGLPPMWMGIRGLFSLESGLGFGDVLHSMFLRHIPRDKWEITRLVFVCAGLVLSFTLTLLVKRIHTLRYDPTFREWMKKLRIGEWGEGQGFSLLEKFNHAWKATQTGILVGNTLLFIMMIIFFAVHPKYRTFGVIILVMTTAILHATAASAATIVNVAINCMRLEIEYYIQCELDGPTIGRVSGKDKFAVTSNMKAYLKSYMDVEGKVNSMCVAVGPVLQMLFIGAVGWFLAFFWLGILVSQAGEDETKQDTLMVVSLGIMAMFPAAFLVYTLTGYANLTEMFYGRTIGSKSILRKALDMAKHVHDWEDETMDAYQLFISYLRLSNGGASLAPFGTISRQSLFKYATQVFTVLTFVYGAATKH